MIGHLIHGERTDWIPRLKPMLAEGAIKEFEAFDPFAQFEANRGKSLEELLQTFEELRADNLTYRRERAVQTSYFERPGRHPELGLVTVRQLLATWVAHDFNQLAQIAQVMAGQYRGQVGPWAAYLDILGSYKKKAQNRPCAFLLPGLEPLQ